MSHDDRIVLAQLQDEVQIPQKLARSIHCISSMPLQVAAGILMHCKKKEKREPVPVKPGCGGLVGDVYGSTNRNLPSHVTRQNNQPGLQVSHYCLGVLWKIDSPQNKKNLSPCMLSFTMPICCNMTNSSQHSIFAKTKNTLLIA